MKKELFLICLVLVLLSSCASKQKSYLILQGMEEGQKYPVEKKHEAIIQYDDRLSIKVSCKNPELAIPFNVTGQSIQVDANGNPVVSSMSATTKSQGYRVDSDGYIDFPILGKLYVQGMTLNQAIDLIRTRIIESNYIKDPLVFIEFLNFKYTVMGAVGSNGTFSVDGDRITILEAIAKTGELSSRANIKHVSVIREVGGERQVYYVDLRTKDIFDSPCYFLQQNDIVYVEPRYKKKDREDRSLQIFTLLLAVISAGSSLYWAVK